MHADTTPRGHVCVLTLFTIVNGVFVLTSFIKLKSTLQSHVKILWNCARQSTASLTITNGLENFKRTWCSTIRIMIPMRVLMMVELHSPESLYRLKPMYL